MQDTPISSKIMANDQGFVLIAALLILFIMVIIGISATTIAVLELQIAGADRTHTQTFYQADAGTQLAAGLIEASVASVTSFTNLIDASDGAKILTDPDNANRTIVIGKTPFDDTTLPLWENDRENLDTLPKDPTDIARDAAYYPIDTKYPNGYDPATATTAPHTNITLAGDITNTAGQGLQMVAGYEGLGKGTASGGAQILYIIKSQHIGYTDSVSLVQTQWRHVIGMEEDARY